MANKHRGEAIVKIDGHEKKLRYDFNAIAELEDLRGKSLNELVALMSEGDFHFGFIRDALYCGMLWSNQNKRGFTKYTIGEMMVTEELSGYAKAVSEVLMSTMGVSKGDIAKALKDAEDENQDPPVDTPDEPEEPGGTCDDSNVTPIPLESDQQSSGF